MIRPRFNQSQFEDALKAKIARFNQQIIRRFQYLGELCLTEARNNKTYMDVTGNLTASIGYVVVAHGSIISTGGFEGSQSEGAAKGEMIAKELAANSHSGFALIMVAGMDYAAAVESRGKIVLASAEMLAERELPKLLKKLINNSNNI